ncbi:zf-TFIIB domain-containing protein [Candidatus Woesearchaeota archaeon]|nr:zf-TFIIB domain-containing protein [Candidatus Woesearchaeota archaeon]
MLTHCPECQSKLHEGQHKFPDGIFVVKYCKNCGFREERALF